MTSHESKKKEEKRINDTYFRYTTTRIAANLRQILVLGKLYSRRYIMIVGWEEYYHKTNNMDTLSSASEKDTAYK